MLSDGVMSNNFNGKLHWLFIIFTDQPNTYTIYTKKKPNNAGCLGFYNRKVGSGKASSYIYRDLKIHIDSVLYSQISATIE